MLTPPEWMRRAACAGMAADPFFPADPAAVTPEAAAACGGCPVRPQCLDFALTRPQKGTWGGVSELRRRALRKNQLKVQGRAARRGEAAA